MVTKVYTKEDGWIPIDYTEMVELIVRGEEIILKATDAQLYYKNLPKGGDVRKLQDSS